RRRHTRFSRDWSSDVCSSDLFRKLTVEENLLAVLEVMGLSPAQRRERLEELLEEFQITGVRKRYGYMLSGGERRRTEIARALAASPSFLLLEIGRAHV